MTAFTWATLNAPPMVEVGDLTAETLGVGPNTDSPKWLDRSVPSRKRSTHGS